MDRTNWSYSFRFHNLSHRFGRCHHGTLLSFIDLCLRNLCRSTLHYLDGNLCGGTDPYRKDNNVCSILAIGGLVHNRSTIDSKTTKISKHLSRSRGREKEELYMKHKITNKPHWITRKYIWWILNNRLQQIIIILISSMFKLSFCFFLVFYPETLQFLMTQCNLHRFSPFFFSFIRRTKTKQ